MSAPDSPANVTLILPTGRHVTIALAEPLDCDAVPNPIRGRMVADDFAALRDAARARETPTPPVFGLVANSRIRRVYLERLADYEARTVPRVATVAIGWVAVVDPPKAEPRDCDAWEHAADPEAAPW
jgi:hypothetical protein